MQETQDSGKPKRRFSSIFMEDVQVRPHGSWMSRTERHLRFWVQAAGWLFGCAAVVAVAWGLIWAINAGLNRHDAQTAAEQAPHIATFASTLHTSGWELTGETDVYDGQISAYVVFGDCRDVIKATAPYDNPASVSIALPWLSGRSLRTVTVRLADAPFAKVKQNRGNYALKQCFLEPVPQSTGGLK